MGTFMKLFFSSLLMALALFSTSNGYAWDDCCCECESSLLSDIRVEARVAYYRPSSKKVKEIYGNGWADYQVELSKGFCDNWRAFVGVSGFSKSGRSLGEHDKTTLRLIPLTFGVKYVYNYAPCVDIYIGGGAAYSWLRIKDHSSYVHEHVKKSRFGGIAQIGAYYYFNECLFADVFIDYLFQKYDFSNSHSYSRYVERHDVNLSGFKVGAGLGYRF
ncbi:conserved hypothetical protein [Candidatus Protochlamydia naegleriophila]|uniref:Uncharacterized protein n=2 Tax=Candidatus Protochlamydia naegleriophila TaxID=389348 RepID=A0A0U5J7M8_9BACT|nr:conserved hypothetical protein [Candidatus Protochlamydia naegleriophila]